MKVCPNCFSEEVGYAGEKPGTTGFLTSAVYKCDNCGYQGSLILEVTEEELKALKNDF